MMWPLKSRLIMSISIDCSMSLNELILASNTVSCCFPVFLFSCAVSESFSKSFS